MASIRAVLFSVALLGGLVGIGAQAGDAEPGNEPIALRTMGSLFFGGTATRAADGETFHGDHGYAQYFIPMNAHRYPLILWHGIGQSGRSYESTPDGREGFMAILPRRDWAVYIIDQPRRGRAGRTQATTVVNAVPTTLRESSAWNAFRNGLWTPPGPPRAYPGVLFPTDPGSIDQFFRQQTPDTGAEPRNHEHYAFMGRTMAALFERTGPAVLVTHSNSGKYGWYSAMTAPEAVRAVIAFEPGHFVFPEGESLAEIPSGTEEAGEAMRPIRVSAEEFAKLTRMPILIVYGDNIATEPSPVFNVNAWRISRARARQFADVVNRRGGDARVLSLPDDLGIKGNTHVPFADLNNLQVADLLEAFLAEKQLDGRDAPHTGPLRGNMAEYTISGLGMGKRRTGVLSSPVRKQF